MDELFFDNVPYGNGQTVFIDKDWLDGALERDTLLHIEPTSAKVLYSVLVKCLNRYGYNVITDENLVTDDTFFFTLCDDTNLNKKKFDFRNRLNEKINSITDSGTVKRPYSVSFPIDSFPDVLPPLPFLLKNENNHGGSEKYLIKTEEQVEILKKFYGEGEDYYFKDTLRLNRKRYPWFADIEFNRDGSTSDDSFQMPIPHYKDRLHRDFILQSYVETPTKYNTSLRVLTASSGDILCSSLKYSEPGKGFLNKKDTCFDLLLANPKSPYFIGSENVFSNTVAGGNSILLGNYKSYSEEEKNIMFAHYIDPWNAVVPKDVIDTSLKIAMACRRELGSICGMDFIFDNKTKTWKYLELHQFPMLSSYAELYNYSYPSPKTDYNKFLSAHRFIDLKARLAALSLMMMRK